MGDNMTNNTREIPERPAKKRELGRPNVVAKKGPDKKTNDTEKNQ